MASVSLLAVGDIFLKTKNGKNPFEKMKVSFSNKDILFGNLETVLSNEGELAKKAVPLFSPPESVQYLKDAGFDIVNLANNHIFDRNETGLVNTVKCVESAGIQHIGVLSPMNNNHFSIIEKNGIKIGFLGYTTGRFKDPFQCKINRVKESSIISDINNLWRFEQISVNYLNNNLNSYKKRIQNHGIMSFLSVVFG